MSQNTSALGRMGVLNPEFLFDVTDGGTALYNAVTAMFEAFSDHVISRYKSVPNMADAATTSVIHNFGQALTEVEVLVFESGVPLNKVQRDALYSITQVNTNEIQIENISGGTRSPYFVVLGFSLLSLAGKKHGSVSTSDATQTTLLSLAIPTDKSVVVSLMVNGRGSAAENSYIVRGVAKNASGTVTFTQLAREVDEGDSDWSLSVAGSGANLLVRVTGEAATPIDWHGSIDISLF